MKKDFSELEKQAVEYEEALLDGSDSAAGMYDSLVKNISKLSASDKSDFLNALAFPLYSPEEYLKYEGS